MSPMDRTISKGVERVRTGAGATGVLSREPQKRGRGVGHGFTLIELLAVIAIIGLLAGLVIGLSGVATEKSRRARTTGEHARLVTAIEAYKLDIGSYPPDNQKIDPFTLNTSPQFYERAGLNTLFYELSGATFANNNGGEFTTLHGGLTVASADLTANFGNKGVQNSARDKRNVPYRGISFKPSSYAQLDVSGNVHILVTPLKGPHDSQFKIKNNNQGANPWFYNLTGTNKHNPDSYDLWAEYNSGTMRSNGVNVPKVATIGNWKE
jgi:prepilin-type N-terminal cleavage/methylation domain-containing protein